MRAIAKKQGNGEGAGDAQIATNKIETLSEKLSDLRSSDPKEQANRIFRMMYAGVIIKVTQGEPSPSPFQRMATISLLADFDAETRLKFIDDYLSVSPRGR